MWAGLRRVGPGRRRPRPGAGGGMTRPFTDAEYAARLRRVQAVWPSAHSPRWSSPTRRTSTTSPATTPGRSTPRSAWWCRPTGLPHLFARAMDAQGAPLHGHLARGPHPRISRRPRAPPGRAPLRLDRRPGPGARLVEDAAGVDRRRDGRALLLRARLPGPAEPPPPRGPGGLAGAGQLGAGGQVARRAGEDAGRGSHRRTRDGHGARRRRARRRAVRRRRRDPARPGDSAPRRWAGTTPRSCPCCRPARRRAPRT